MNSPEISQALEVRGSEVVQFGQTEEHDVVNERPSRPVPFVLNCEMVREGKSRRWVVEEADPVLRMTEPAMHAVQTIASDEVLTHLRLVQTVSGGLKLSGC